jgi:hypothetical protein
LLTTFGFTAGFTAAFGAGLVFSTFGAATSGSTALRDPKKPRFLGLVGSCLSLAKVSLFFRLFRAELRPMSNPLNAEDWVRIYYATPQRHTFAG